MCRWTQLGVESKARKGFLKQRVSCGGLGRMEVVNSGAASKSGWASGNLESSVKCRFGCPTPRYSNSEGTEFKIKTSKQNLNQKRLRSCKPWETVSALTPALRRASGKARPRSFHSYPQPHAEGHGVRDTSSLLGR